MRRTPGFTLLELMITVAMIGIVAAIAIPTMRAATRNASVSSSAFDLQLKLQQLKTLAMNEQRTLLAVLVDAPGNDATGCGVGARVKCTKLFILGKPQATWQLSTFDPADPDALADVVEIIDLGRAIRLATDKAGTSAPFPFDAVKVFDANYAGTCDGKRCMAIRYSPNGTVSAEKAVGTAPRVRGVAFGIGSEMTQLSAGAESRGVLVAFPSGIVKSFGL